MLCERPYNLTTRIPILFSCCNDTSCKECWFAAFNPKAGMLFYCPYKCKIRDREDHHKQKVNVAMSRLVEQNLPADVTCDRHPH